MLARKSCGLLQHLISNHVVMKLLENRLRHDYFGYRKSVEDLSDNSQVIRELASGDINSKRDERMKRTEDPKHNLLKPAVVVVQSVPAKYYILAFMAEKPPQQLFRATIPSSSIEVFCKNKVKDIRRHRWRCLSLSDGRTIAGYSSDSCRE